MPSQSYANRFNLEYIEQQYEVFKSNPDQLEQGWRSFFEGMEFGQDARLGLSDKELDVYHLITAYRNYGHFEANLDPLANVAPPSEELSLRKYNLSEADLDKRFHIGSIIGKPNATLKEIIAFLRETYCGKLTVQVAEALPDVRNWFIEEFEKGHKNFKLTPEQKKDAFHSITRTESLEKFLHTRFVGAKRFSVEGADALLPMLENLVTRATPLGVREIVIGMAHRGRINVLANFMGKGLETILGEFAGLAQPEETIEDADGDVKYHMGFSADKETPNGNCHISLAFNPSHLEAVDPVVCGMTRAKQRVHKDTETRKKVVPVLIHGDAAFAGQGVVAETFQLAHTKGYTVGGSIHIVIDNQVGFTTGAEEGRSSHYSSDIAKILATPVLHVNGDDTEACIHAIDIAIRYRQKFGRDIVVTMMCYRRFGHNEGDEPSFTQPQMYEIIKNHPTLREIYGKQLIREGVIDQAQYDSLYQEKIDNLQNILEDVRKNPPKTKFQVFSGLWQGLRRARPEDFLESPNTAVDKKTLTEIGRMLGQVPEGFTPHKKLLKLLETRTQMAEGEVPIDWGMAELLAFGSLLKEGTSVRLTGQDSIRGTFTHRHSKLFDVQTGEVFSPLAQVNPEKEFCVYNSILSEYAVLGFEYGNSIGDPTFLTIWEAQFGDFANSAQIIIDQFISSGESKWQRMTGLVLLLPHGYEGQGPEHSSARLERFLNLCAQNNMQVINPTTPAQIFHALRRQVRRDFRKPLIVMSPKKLLRYNRAVSSLDELSQGKFQELINDSSVKDASKVKRLILCSGKLYYDLIEAKERLEKGAEQVAIVRIEQLYPFPRQQLIATLKSMKSLEHVVWAQEEPQNMGAWTNVFFPIQSAIEEAGVQPRFNYVGRTHRASPATGKPLAHEKEQEEIIKICFSNI